MRLLHMCNEPIGITLVDYFERKKSQMELFISTVTWQRTQSDSHETHHTMQSCLLTTMETSSILVLHTLHTRIFFMLLVDYIRDMSIKVTEIPHTATRVATSWYTTSL